jgi:hypothetical protein
MRQQPAAQSFARTAGDLPRGWKLPASSCLGFLEADCGAVMIFLFV